MPVPPLTPPYATIVGIGQPVGDNITLSRADGGQLETFPAKVLNIAALARNAALGGSSPAQVVPQTPATVTVNWSAVESTGAAGTNVPITPVVTGRLSIQGVLVVEIQGELSEDVVNVLVFIDGVQVATISSGIDAPAASGNSFVAIPFLLEDITSAVGVTHNVQVKANVVNQSTTNIFIPVGTNQLSAIRVTEYANAATG